MILTEYSSWSVYSIHARSSVVRQCHRHHLHLMGQEMWQADLLSVLQLRELQKQVKGTFKDTNKIQKVVIKFI